MIHNFSLTTLARCGLATVLILLAACAPIQQPPSTSIPASWPQHQQQVAQLTRWDIIGKLGIRTPEQSNSARFNWQQLEQQFDISVTNLLGQSVASLSGSDKEVQLNIAGHGNYITDQPDALLQQELGWTLPISMLRYWVKGIPSPDSEAIYQLNNQGLMDSLSQAGWQVDFSRYKALESHSLPSKIRMQQGDIKLTLIIKRWSLNPDG